MKDIELLKPTYNKWSVDSFKIRIPFYECMIKSNILDKYYIKIDDETGEKLSDEEFKETSFAYETLDGKMNINTGIKCRYQIQHIHTSKFVCILINSKLLKENYFTGFTAYNLQDLFHIIISQNVISCDYETFKNSECTDVDFKNDQYKKLDDYCDWVDILKEHTKESNDFLSGSRIRGSKFTNNYGIEFSTRKNGCEGRPFIKFYNKQGELETEDKKGGSNKFATYHLNKMDFRNARRIEFTIKNKKMFKYYFNSKDNSLEQILLYTQSSLNKVFIDVLYKHFKTFSEVAPKKVYLSGKDLLIYAAIELLIVNTTMSENQIENQLLKLWLDEDCKASQSIKNDKSRQRKKIHEIFKKLKADQKNPLKKLKYNNTFSAWIEGFILQSDIKKTDYSKYGYS